MKISFLPRPVSQCLLVNLTDQSNLSVCGCETYKSLKPHLVASKQKKKTSLLKTNWDSGHVIVDMSQIDAIRSFTILKETVDPIVEAASDFLNMTNPHMISEVFETHVLNLDRWKTKVGFQIAL